MPHLQHYFATAPLGLELLLVQELTELGATQAREARAGVYFQGTQDIAYKACLWSRLANRILYPLVQFPASTPESLYAGIRAMAWHEHMDVDSLFAIDFATSRSVMTHTLYGAQKVKDGIVDYFREQEGRRPSVDLAKPDVRINVYLDRDVATVSIDLSGDSLHKRGYRLEGGKAPLKENLAAALLLRAGWPGVAQAGGNFLDPMCGSGTLLVEAAWMAGDQAPGLHRDYYGFFGWKQHDPALWDMLLQSALARAKEGRSHIPLITGHDIDSRAVWMARDNVERAGMADIIQVEKKSVTDIRPSAGYGLVLVNPPYGERLGVEEQLIPLYSSLGASLQQHFTGWKASVFTGNPELAFKLGIRARRQYRLYNGAIECRLFNFEVDQSSFFTPHGKDKPDETAHENSRLLARARVLATETGGAEMFANRLGKNLKNLRRWAKQQDISCYRIYDADLPEYAIACDLYQGEQPALLVQEYEAPASVDPLKAEARLVDALAALPRVLDLPMEQVYLKVRRRQKGTSQYEKLAEAKRFHVVAEGGHQFWVNFEDYLDTGLFLDHRLTRQRLQSQARGQRFLNLFAYTGSATVYAIRGGAVASTSVDLSKTYLDWAARNLALNGLGGAHHELVQADCLEWLDAAARARRQFDLIFLDPPTFSSSKRMEGTLDIQRDHVDLIHRCLKLLAHGGLLVFSTNHRRFKLDADALPANLKLTDISRATLPRDFERNPRIHQCWEMQF